MGKLGSNEFPQYTLFLPLIPHNEFIEEMVEL
jgi:hypothetical protein